MLVASENMIGWMLKELGISALLAILAGSQPVAAKQRPDQLAIWRRPDHQGRACASCHSPSGIELAAYNFSDADILRRAQTHLSFVDSMKIVGMIHDQRDRYHLTKLLDPITDRPMQPGGLLLEGKTPLERDERFGQELEKWLPAMFSGRIGSEANAFKARDQICAINLNDLPIGVPVNRISEDGFRGAEHATIADWIPDAPLSEELPLDIQDAYVNDPGSQTFGKLQAALKELGPRQTTLGQKLSWAKRWSLLIFANQLQERALGHGAPPIIREGNPMWEIGEFGRLARNRQIPDLQLPTDIAAKKLIGPYPAEQFKNLRLGWYWLGWCADPGLQHIARLAQTQRADYFSHYLLEDGPYPMHLAWMTTRKILSESFDPSAWNSRVRQHLDLNCAGLFNANGVAKVDAEPPTQRARREKFLRNSFRMMLYLQICELKRTHIVYLRLALLQQLDRMTTLFHERSDLELIARAKRIVATCTDASD